MMPSCGSGSKKLARLCQDTNWIWAVAFNESNGCSGSKIKPCGYGMCDLFKHCRDTRVGFAQFPNGQMLAVAAMTAQCGYGMQDGSASELTRTYGLGLGSRLQLDGHILASGSRSNRAAMGCADGSASEPYTDIRVGLYPLPSAQMVEL